jgi:hypothetical protein
MKFGKLETKSFTLSRVKLTKTAIAALRVKQTKKHRVIVPEQYHYSAQTLLLNLSVFENGFSAICSSYTDNTSNQTPNSRRLYFKIPTNQPTKPPSTQPSHPKRKIKF